MKHTSKLLIFASAILLMGLGSCKKSFLDRYPSNEVPIKDAFKTTTGCKAALEGIHSLMYRATGNESFGQASINLMNDLMGEDMPMHDQGSGWFIDYANYSAPRGGASYIWTYYYSFINNCNEILEHIDSAKGPQSDKNNIKGQTYFYLAWAYYNLSIYYSHTYAADSTALCVPIYHHVTQTGGARATVREVYQEIRSDLDSAQRLLNPANGAPQRINKSEINIDVVHGLQARVALVMHDWHTAEQKAMEVLAKYPYMTRQQLLGGFNNWQNSSWIWGSHLQEDQTNGVYSFISQMDPTAGGYAAIGGQKLLNKTLYNFIPHRADDPPGIDIRRHWWAESDSGAFFKFGQEKFRILTPGSFSLDLCYMRAAEMGLIQAEAEAHMGQLEKARETLVKLMQIRDQGYTKAYADANFDTKTKLLVEIWFERRIELWGEGFRYSDLQRCAVFPAATSDNSNFPGYLWYSGLHRGKSGGSSTIYGSADNYTPLDNRFLFRIPGSEMEYNPHMVQNP